MEQDIQKLGLRLLEAARLEEEALNKRHRWENAFLDWCMKNEELKIRTFRFIDVFPSLHTADAVLKHIKEYFPSSEHRLPKSIRAGLLLTKPSLLTKHAIHQVTKTMFLKIARFFVAATDEDEALAVLKSLYSDGIRSSMDLLGESTVSEKESEIFFERYKALIVKMGELKLGVDLQNVSVKLSALDPLFDSIDPDKTSERVRARLRKLIRLAREQQVFIHIDMEDYSVRDLTLKIVRDLLEEEEFKEGIDLGVVLQAYLRDAEECLDSVFEWALDLPKPLTIRLVRGAYWDQEIMKAEDYHWPIPVFMNKNDTDAMFEKLAEKILRHSPKIRLAAATHNIRSIAFTMACAEKYGVQKDDYEFQLLYGMGTSLMNALAHLGFSPRMYMPIGDPVWGMAYLVRRLLENVSSQSFIRMGVHEHGDPSILLAKPEFTLGTGSKSARLESGETGQVKQPGTFRTGTFKGCPPLEFYKGEVNQAFRNQIDCVTSRLDLKLPLVYRGVRRKTSDEIEHLSPNDEKTVVVRGSIATQKEVSEALEASKKAFTSWSTFKVKTRADYLRKAAKWMAENREELAALEVYEVGKPYREADADLKEAIDFLNYYAHAGESLLQQKDTEALPHEKNYLIPEARGVCSVIAPWNFPIAIITGMSAAALITGNTVILKPAEQSMLSAWKLFEAYQAAGIPGDVVQFLTGPGDVVGRMLAEDPRVSIVAFTGSREVGCQIANNANSSRIDQTHLKELVIEMGGKNAAIIDETADFDQAVPDVLHSAFTFAGQKCSALSRLIIVGSVYERFKERLLEAAESFPYGNPLEPEVRCGPIIDREAKKKIETFVEKGKLEGKLIFQAKGTPDTGHYVPPTIFEALPAGFELLKKEIFGPVLCLERARSFNHALELANNTDCGLTGGVFSRTPSHIEQAKREFRVGNLYVNRSITGAVVGRQPFGGIKMSGNGTKAGSSDYLRHFYFEKTISENVSRHGFAPLKPAEL